MIAKLQESQGPNWKQLLKFENGVVLASKCSSSSSSAMASALKAETFLHWMQRPTAHTAGRYQRRLIKATSRKKRKRGEERGEEQKKTRRTKKKKKERSKVRRSRKTSIGVSSSIFVPERRQKKWRSCMHWSVRSFAFSFCSESLATEEIRPEERKERWKGCPVKRGSITQKELCHHLHRLRPTR